ncbi:cysteine-rich receptor-like protein kinase 10 [Prunus avium]|uniref:Cysteine-rich receptor-like protein kinase 10 n=1 Tax=Prunus avium TaxID=42229 RepID=A0A6P5SBQ1_PRUAV|nr:cysteine-rich receptor-like protein kinase 10 [Prunus avium]
MQFLALYAPYFLFVSCLLQVSHPTIAQTIYQFSNCNTTVNYTSGSVYEQNLNLTLNYLVANASLTGFYTTSIGENSDVVYGLVQCRGDLSKVDCHTCANTAATEIRQLCFSQKEASVGYINCSLQYSAHRFFSTFDSFPGVQLHNTQTATDPAIFKRQSGNLVKNLSSKAASDPSRFALGFTSYTDFNDIYGMAQCTQDLAENTCLTCLQEIASHVPKCCDGYVGATLISKSCYLRYEIYSFFLSPIEHQPPPVASPPSPSLLEPKAGHAGKFLGKKSNSKIILIIVIPLALALTVIATSCAGYLFWKKAKRNGVDDVPVLREDGNNSMDALLIGLSTLKVATNNFSEAYKLGEGGFGPVYKGKLPDEREIAVKRLSRSSEQGLAELKTEVMLVAKLLHRNLVRLLGFCLEDEEKLLVYEYLPNGSLDKILFDQRRPFGLEWERRFKIIVGIARGLLYLHEDSQLRIVHRDLKASNIPLDEEMNPKISDFGLAKLFCGSQTHGNTNRISGTFGYMAPEYARNGKFSTKSDAYSFGVLVMEIITGRKNSSFRKFSNLQSYAWQHWANGTALELLDPRLGDQWPRYEVLKCVHIGLLCVQEAPAERPTMSEVVMMLNSYTINSAIPSQPAFYVRQESSADSQQSVARLESYGAFFELDQLAEATQSVNDLTVTELCPR